MTITPECYEAKDDHQPNPDIMVEIVSRLRNIASVLRKEHDWLMPKVTEARAELEEEIKFGSKDEDFDRGWDDLMLKSKQVDKHLENIRGGAEYITDIADVLKMMFAVTEEVGS